MNEKETKLKTTKPTKSKAKRKPRGSRDMLAEKYAKNLRAEGEIILQKFGLLADLRVIRREQNKLIKQAMEKRETDCKDEKKKLKKEQKNLKVREKKAAKDEVS